MSFYIHANPDVRVVTPNQPIDFRLVSDWEFDRNEVSDIRWVCINDASPEGLQERPWAAGPRFPGPRDSWVWEGEDWDFVGHHRIVCAFTYRDQRQSAEYPVNVISVADMAEHAPVFSDDVTSPTAVLESKRREYRLIRDEESRRPGPSDRQEEYENRMQQRQEYIDHLAELLESSNGRERCPIKAQYYSPQNAQPGRGTGQWMDLHVFLTQWSDGCWAVVDWTNPTTTHSSGNYGGVAGWRYRSPEEAIEAWNSGNSYPEGIIRYEYRSNAQAQPALVYADQGTRRMRGNPGGHRTHSQFETDGLSTIDHVTQVYDWIAIGGAVIAGVVTLVAPVPGSRVASAVIWTALFTSIAAGTASSALRIAARAEDGHSNWRDDGFDCLSIAANLLAVGAVVRTAGAAARAGGAAGAWTRGAVVTSSRSLAITRGVVIASFSSDVIQGVIVGAQQIDGLERITNNRRLTPEERVTRMIRAIAELAATGVLVVINVRATRADLNHLNTPNRQLPPELTPQERLNQLQDPDAVVNLDARPRGEGNTADGRHRSRVETNPAGHPSPDQATTRRTGEVTTPRTNRSRERPYRRPPECYEVRPGEPMPILDPNRSPYLWAVDPDGVIIVAPVRQPGFNPDKPARNTVKHRDLLPNPDGNPGPGRAGGEFVYNPNNGEWIMNNESSMTFARQDRQHLGRDELEASYELLEQSGTDVSNITWSNTDGRDRRR